MILLLLVVLFSFDKIIKKIKFIIIIIIGKTPSYFHIFDFR